MARIPQLSLKGQMIVGGFASLGFLSPSPTKAVMSLMLIGLAVGVVCEVASGRMRFGNAELRKMAIMVVYGAFRHTALGMGIASVLIAIVYQDILKSSLLAAIAISLLLLALLPPRVYFRSIESIDVHGTEAMKMFQSLKFIAIIAGATIGVIFSSPVALGDPAMSTLLGHSGHSPAIAIPTLMTHYAVADQKETADTAPRR